jgi:hypothetical protein
LWYWILRLDEVGLYKVRLGLNPFGNCDLIKKKKILLVEAFPIGHFTKTLPRLFFIHFKVLFENYVRF